MFGAKRVFILWAKPFSFFFFSSFLTYYTQRTLEETNIGDTWEKGKHRKQTNKQTNKT